MSAPEPGGESRITAWLRSPPARLIGVAVGAVTFGLLVASLVESTSRGHGILGDAPLARLPVAFAGFLLFHAGAIGSLDRLGATPAPPIWAAAQLAKYFPAPGSALAGMVHASVQKGHTARRGVELTGRHSGVLLGAAVAVGALATGSLARRELGWTPWAAAPLVPAGLALALLSAGRLPLRRRMETVGLAVIGWAAVAVLVPIGLSTGHTAEVGSAFCAAWAVGFAALPVPAGIGVREAMLLLLLEHRIGLPAATAYAVITRALHVASDGTVAIAVLRPRLRRRESRPATPAFGAATSADDDPEPPAPAR